MSETQRRKAKPLRSLIRGGNVIEGNLASNRGAVKSETQPRHSGDGNYTSLINLHSAFSWFVRHPAPSLRGWKREGCRQAIADPSRPTSRPARRSRYAISSGDGNMTVLVTASTTKSEPVRDPALIVRGWKLFGIVMSFRAVLRPTPSPDIHGMETGYPGSNPVLQRGCPSPSPDHQGMETHCGTPHERPGRRIRDPAPIVRGWKPGHYAVGGVPEGSRPRPRPARRSRHEVSSGMETR